MFFEGLRSERQLMRVLSDRLSLRWYLGYDLFEPLPDHSSLTRIRDRLGLGVQEMLFRSTFRWGLRPCSVTGDAAYGTRENITAIEKAGIRAYTALPEQGKRTSQFIKEVLAYDAERDLYTCPALLWEVGFQESGAVFVDGYGAGFLEVLRVEGAAGEDGHGAYAGIPGGLDVPEGVPQCDGLFRRGPCPPQGLFEDVGGGFRVIDGAGVNHAVYDVLRFEFLHVVFQLFVFRAGHEPDLVAAFFERGDQLLRPGERVAELLEPFVESSVELLNLLHRLIVVDETADQQLRTLSYLPVQHYPRHPMSRLLERPRPRLGVQVVRVHQRAVNVENDHLRHEIPSHALESDLWSIREFPKTRQPQTTWKATPQ